MRTSAIRIMATGTLFFACLILSSCSGPSGPQGGTPAFYWSAAKETFAASDYLKTVEHLEKLNATDNEYTARARPWLLVMTSGMARGYMDLADNFDAGAHANKTNPIDFRRRTNTYRGEANRLTLEFVEVFDKFQQGKDDPVAIAFSFPSGSAAPVAQLAKVAAGMTLQPTEIEPAEKRAIVRGVLLASCDAAGAPDDTAKAEQLLKPGTLTIPRAAFVTSMAATLFDESRLYGARQMDNPDKLKILCNRALDALKTVPETKQTKELSTKITKSLKKT
jgi:hypothetical protein